MAEEKRKTVIELQNVKRYFQVGSETVKALRGVSFKIYEGEFVTIQGTSGVLKRVGRSISITITPVL